VNNIIMKKVMCPLVMNLYYFCGKGGKDERVKSKEPQPVNAGTPAIRRIHLSNVTAREAGASAGFFYGLPEMPIEDIELQNVSIHMAADARPDVPAMMDDLQPMQGRGIFCRFVKNVSFGHVRITGHKGEDFTLDDCQGVQFM